MSIGSIAGEAKHELGIGGNFDSVTQRSQGHATRPELEGEGEGEGESEQLIALQQYHIPMLRQLAARRLARPAASPAFSAHVPRRTFLSRRSDATSGRAVENLNIRRMSQQAEEYHRNRRIFLWCGTVAGVVSFIYTAYKLKQALSKPARLDANLPSSDPLAGPNGGADRKVVIHDEEGREIIPTGNSTVPTFPRTLHLPSYTGPKSSGSSPQGTPTITTPTTEYTLVGLGLRTVSFINLQVYVVGYYIATSDIAALQSALTKVINPMATTLVPGEREQLRSLLLDPAEGERMWDELLRSGIPARSAFRVVPVRDTDFHHLRDGFVRAIQGRVPAMPGAAEDEAFGEAMRQFRAVFNRGSVPKRKELLLVRDETGRLSIAYDGGGGAKEGGKQNGRNLIGVVEDERVSRALWLNYLAGKKVASEPARKNVVEGIMEFVARPVGTVATQVVPVVNTKI
ncbi:Altered inheritance of mitochondria protein 18, mitochondrial [Madurella mycetomatis]|uniref:Altered inheritance of mitochondria protein 18, mitochondrial n=1 Tax=Madurella mycetomatis TaxID=100816 RepID=A0A175W744_9PEZI|nr:Altered inheritance of mitochondria protein 18, mitochondrial [Madurella mycetomatis]